jgi:hypothetical protein
MQHLNNHNGAVQILSALQNSSVFRSALRRSQSTTFIDEGSPNTVQVCSAAALVSDILS